ncbi:hypothetical protein OJAG_00310 [Oerskovia enterophila]|uniref:Uncharacterized protein n=1 Tax=Oerskovia enterophila TaxID=43678 RepID=A0A163T9H2_9CELL|nr:hypothetical protein OJAG_00310 [Oerskovia enterophila]
MAPSGTGSSIPASAALPSPPGGSAGRRTRKPRLTTLATTTAPKTRLDPPCAIATPATSGATTAPRSSEIAWSAATAGSWVRGTSEGTAAASATTLNPPARPSHAAIA